MTFTANNTYYSSIDFSTEQGYIVGGVIWANGNLYYENNEYKFFPNTEDFIGGTNTGEIFYYNALLPYPSFTTDPVKTWNPANDPCSKIAPANTWRTPSSKDFTKLQEAGYTIDAASGSKKGFKFGNTLFLPYCGYLQSRKLLHIIKTKTIADYMPLPITNIYLYFGTMLITEKPDATCLMTTTARGMLFVSGAFGNNTGLADLLQFLLYCTTYDKKAS